MKKYNYCLFQYTDKGRLTLNENDEPNRERFQPCMYSTFEEYFEAWQSNHIFLDMSKEEADKVKAYIEKEELLPDFEKGVLVTCISIDEKRIVCVDCPYVLKGNEPKCKEGCEKTELIAIFNPDISVNSKNEPVFCPVEEKEILLTENNKEWAKQCAEDSQRMAIGFAEWIWINAQPMAPNKNEWVLYKDKKTTLKTIQLFDIYINQ